MAPEEHLEMIEKSIDFGKKKIVYHENSHLLFSYLFGFACRYVDYTIHSKVDLNNGNVEMDFQSLAHADINLPPVLEEYFAFLHIGGTTENFIAQTGISEDTLTSSTIAYLAILYAGYETERHYFSGEEYSDIKKYIDQYSEDFTLKNIHEDETKANMILTNLGFDDDTRSKIRDQSIEKIRAILKEEKMKSLLEGLYEKSLHQNRLSKTEIEDYLSKNQFEEWRDTVIE